MTFPDKKSASTRRNPGSISVEGDSNRVNMASASATVRMAARGGENKPACERDLLSRLRARDESALLELVREHQDSVMRLAGRLLGWRSDPDDVVQEVFLAAWEKLAEFRGEARIATWLYTVTVNACRRHQRRRLSQWNLLERLRNRQPQRSSTAPTSRLDDQEVGEQVRRAIRTLPARYREVVVLRYLEDLPIAAIAAIVGVQPNTVETRLSRARKRLQSSLSHFAEV